jgi:hypothetical protein
MRMKTGDAHTQYPALHTDRLETPMMFDEGIDNWNIGMVHCLPNPGKARERGTIMEIRKAALMLGNRYYACSCQRSIARSVRPHGNVARPQFECSKQERQLPYFATGLKNARTAVFMD